MDLVALGFTYGEIAKLHEPYNSHHIEKYLFSLLYGHPVEINFPRHTETEGKTYLGSWSWVLPQDVFPGLAYGRLRSNGIFTVGLLQMVSEERLRTVGLGDKSIDAIQSYLEARRLRLSRPQEAPRSRAIRVYRILSRIPIEYLTARTGFSVVPLQDRGINLVSQMSNIPKQRLLSIPFDRGRFDNLNSERIDAFERELTALGFGFKNLS